MAANSAVPLPQNGPNKTPFGGQVAKTGNVTSFSGKAAICFLRREPVCSDAVGTVHTEKGGFVSRFPLEGMATAFASK